MALTFRALEMHGRRMWERARVIEALEFIRAHEMTALVLHESDLVHQLVFPRAYFDPYAEWKSAPARRGENALQNNRVYFDHVLHLAKAYGTEVWIEVKELAFPDEVLEMRPELIKGGHVCPSDPFWGEFIEQKTEELLADFPLLAGLIVSPGSPEGRASRAQNKCECEVCARTSLADWYGGIIAALHRPVTRHGKRLAIRDFAYKPSDHKPLIEAVERAPQDVIFCIKTTPHDFYPTFPDNPALGRLNREQWVEYDVQGQFYGWGVIPCFVFDDLKRRLAFAETVGVTGGLFRTEWERVNDWSCFDSLNVLNLIAAAALGRGGDVDAEAVCARWLADKDLPKAHAQWLAGLMSETWPIIRQALYIDDFVFADCSMFPRSIGRAWWTMEIKHSLAAWDPSREHDLELDATRVSDLIDEKARAIQLARGLQERIATGEHVPQSLRDLILGPFVLIVTFVEGLALCAEVCLHARWLQQAGDAGDPGALGNALDKLETYGASLRPMIEGARHSHQRIMLLDPGRVGDIVREGRNILASSLHAAAACPN